ncbi:uncharacterized protein [Oscarella lobularis]|uniref:uncharacterized protein isoform X2 n=1 Tax=Oscarella lobularis TaxID=121494 RepID=UPI0033130C70
MAAIRPLTLAPPPLRTPYSYDSSLKGNAPLEKQIADSQREPKVDVRLCEPLWSVKRTPGEIAVAVLAHCTVIEAIARSKAGETVAKRWRNASATAESRMRDLLQQLPVPETDIPAYLEYTGIDSLFPQAAALLERGEDTNVLEEESAVDSDAYFSNVAALNQLFATSKQIGHDVNHQANHKYMAHQTALLHQCLAQMLPFFSKQKTSIEQNFKAIKASCNVEKDDNDPKPHLPDHLKEWMTRITDSIQLTVASFPDELTKAIQPVLDFIELQADI